MENINKIPVYNEKKVNNKIYKDHFFTYHYVNNTSDFSGIVFKDMIEHTNYIKSMHKKTVVPIYYEFPNKGINIVDKLTYILLECYFYYLITHENRKVRIFWEPNQDIISDGVFKSSLIHLNKNYNKEKFLSKFLEDFNFKDPHFRKVFTNKSEINPYYLSEIQAEIDLFLKFFNLNKDSKDDILQVCIELIGNCLEHAKTDCLIDIDVTSLHEKYSKGEKQQGQFYGINIVLINFSDKLLFTDVKKKIITKKNHNAEYSDIIKAHKHHSLFFDDEYKEDCFWCIASMQKGISGRDEKNEGGGTGLYILLKSLMDKSDMDVCYMISGNTFIPFETDLIKENENKHIGFNKVNDFINDIPDEVVFRDCAIYMPGTAYNLNFIMKDEGDIDYEGN